MSTPPASTAIPAVSWLRRSFEEVGEYSAVVHQPTGDTEMRQAYRALLACPTGSIGTERSDAAWLSEAKGDFPLPVEDDVYYCGFNSEKSFGANSFYVRHAEGNWLIDSPRYLKPLVDAFERMGGVAYIFLTHEDDVADAARYAKRFGAKRIIHRKDVHAMPDAEEVIEELTVRLFSPEFTIIPVPGHTAGSMCLLYRDRFLFTGGSPLVGPGASQTGFTAAVGLGCSGPASVHCGTRASPI